MQSNISSSETLSYGASRVGMLWLMDALLLLGCHTEQTKKQGTKLLADIWASCTSHRPGKAGFVCNCTAQSLLEWLLSCSYFFFLKSWEFGK